MSKTVVRPRRGIPLALPHLILSLGLLAFVVASERGASDLASLPALASAPAGSAPVAFLALADLPARP